MKTLDNAYALIIGVDNEQNTPQPMRDAKAIYDVLSNEKLCGYSREKMTLLLDKDATMQNILDALDEIIAKTDEHSSFLLYYSGHGGYESGISFLCPYDKTPDIYISGQELREKLSQMKSKKMVILFDCCHSAAFFQGEDEIITQTISNNTKQGIARQNSGLKGLAQDIDDEQGMVIVASSQPDELSWGDSDDQNSVFTQCLMEALKARHKRFFADEYVRMVETVNYIFERTPELIEILKGRSDIVKDQTPYANLQMNSDFVICYIPEEFRSKIVTNKFKSLSQTEENVVQKAKANDSWERTEGNNLLLFLHGFSGESEGTFGDIPKLLQSDPNFDGWAMKPLGYSHIVQPKLGKDIWAAILDIDKISAYLETSIKFKFKDYHRIAIVAHSLGGLVAQKAILGLDSENLSRISHLVMFGTPSNGIAPQLLTKQWNAKYADMSSEGSFIKTLRKDWDNAFGNNYPFKLKVAASANDEFVTIDSCHGPFEKEHCEIIDQKHLDMVKPRNGKDDDAYLLISNTLTGNKFFNKFTNKEEINLTLGKYDAVIKELLPRKDDLDKNGLKQLIFALEGLDRHEEVYDLLNHHPVAQNNTDLMGILGGRHKRDYLKTYSAKSSRLAFDHYRKALEISVGNEDHPQIYYHAINLAFMSIVTDPESGESQMMAYAKQALEATERCRDNVWKYATVAEASMYIGHMEKAKEFYIKASENAPIREKLSMHTNAYAGYVALMQAANDNDEFIQFLKSRLLS